MLKSTRYPKIIGVRPRPGNRLLVEFDNGERRVYDCTPLLHDEVFRPLRDEALFRCVRADAHGHGVVWNDEIDLAESEVWLNGLTAEPEDLGDPSQAAFAPTTARSK